MAVASGSPVLVVGTVSSARSVLAQLSAAGSGPGVAGVILVDAGDRSAQGWQDPPLLGSIEDIPDVARQLGVTAALVSIPAAMGGAARNVREALARAGVAERFVPTIGDVLSDSGRRAALGAGAVDLQELVGRPARRLDEKPVRELIEGRRVLITGAGGSIGSELALRCAAFNPAALHLMERAENPLFEIDRKLAARHPRMERRAVLHDVVDEPGTLRRLMSLRPDVVFHAAAHKHVPMMEDHPGAAVVNNFFGTKSVADAAAAVGVDRFVMISTDKAVNPTSVMGATKRLAEVYVRSLNGPGSGTRFSLVRFGNVLGSACSVLPIWSAQLAEGGPLTVTRREMTRYFMTIPEAASLVIHAATISQGGSVFVLDMGEPVRIADLAERFVRAHGLEPLWDDAEAIDPGQAERVRIAVTGIRPGEKLHEELAYAAEELQPTTVDGVRSWFGPQPAAADVARMVADMSSIRGVEAPDVVLAMLRRHVPELGKGGRNGIPLPEAA
ncbi:MAG: polysaccharide biosynthesis protein [Planctomycetota bacterium]|nr:polysaccharide biosynthesis protein [Planctomycetota bacterium]